MVVLGLLLLVGAGVFTAAVVTSNTGAVGSDLWGLHISNLSLGGVFVAGIATGAIALLGLVVLLGGMRRARRLHRERKELARENARLTRHADVVEPVAVQPVATEVPVEHAGKPGYDHTVDDREPLVDDREPVVDRHDEHDHVGEKEYVPASTADGTPVVEEPVTRHRR